MRFLMTALLTALSSACAAAAPRGVAPTGGSGSSHGAGPHEHAHLKPHHGPGAGGTHQAFSDPDALTKVFDDPARDEWQRPDLVLQALALDPAMSVADVGAGTGYFAVRLARAVPRGAVIATDLEPGMVRFLNERARREQLPNLRSILASPTASGLVPRSVDRILIVHVWHHLGNRAEYARELATALRPGGRLFVVDFNSAAHRGPPADMRVAPEVVIAELEAAGLSARLSAMAIPEQYIVEARRGP